MSIKNISIRPLKAEDVEQLDLFRRSYDAAYLELPHGMAGNGIETAVAEKDGKISSLTGTACVVIDPFIHDPSLRGVDVFASVFMLERALTYNAARGGALDSYIAVPRRSEDYIEMVKKCGYEETCQDCVILRRPLVPEVVGLIENEAK